MTEYISGLKSDTVRTFVERIPTDFTVDNTNFIDIGI